MTDLKRYAIWVVSLIFLAGSNVATVYIYGLIDAKTDCQQELVERDEDIAGLLSAWQEDTEPDGPSKP